MPKPATAERMGDHEAKVALLLTNARIRDYAHLHRVIDAKIPGWASPETVWRYLYRPPGKLNYRILKAMADALSTDVDELVALIAEARTTPP